MVGNLLIISSPSGGGKGTLIRQVLSRVPGIGYSVSYTTRAARTGEADGTDYHFISREKFENLAAAGDFLEYAEVHGNFYGTSLSAVNEMISAGMDVILEIDVQGAEAVIRKEPEAVAIFIMPPTFEVLRQRLTARNTETPEDLALRLSNSVYEMQKFDMFDYVIVNDEIEAATARLTNVILGERQRRTRQLEEIHAILDSFDTSKSKASGENKT